MKTTKIFMMAALALTFAACSSDDRSALPLDPVKNDFQNSPQPAKTEGIIITATLAPKTGGADTRALAPGDNKIVASWAVGEKIAILYEKGGTNYEADAEIKSVDQSGAATIEFSVESGTADGTACKLIYPSTAVNDAKKAEKSYTSMLASQNGGLNADFDVRVGAGTIHTTKPSLDVTTQPAPQYSIFKFAVKDLSGTNLSVSSFEVSNSQASITTVSLSEAKSEFYVALPTMTPNTYYFNATAGDKNYVAKAVVSKETEAGIYYQSTVQMATVGDVILSDGKFAKASSKETKVAMVAYVGSETGHGYFHGLAIAMTDESDEMNKADLSAAKNTCNNKNQSVPVSHSEWVLPSVVQWKTMFKANGGNDSKYFGLNTALETAGGDPLNKEKIYYTFSKLLDETESIQMVLGDSFPINGVEFGLPDKTGIYYVRACLAF